MNDNETFENELRATLAGLAREPASERLINRVSGIPNREPSALTHGVRPSLSPRGFGSGFALLAAAVAIAVFAIVVRPGVGPSTVGGSPSAAAGLPASAGPSGPSAQVSAEVSPVVASPSPKPAGGPVPVDFEPLSASFVAADDGWVLGSVPCGSARCPAIVRTVDGGATWSSIVAPKTTVGGVPGSTQTGGSGISSLRFADLLNGWAFGPELWATHDGGASWARLTISGLPAEATVTALETSAGTVHAVLYDAAQDFRIGSSRVGADDWRVAAVRVPVGAGPVPRIELLLSGSSGWVLENDRIVSGGATLDAGMWRTWQPACLDVVGPAVLAASSASDLVAVCDVGLWGSPKGEQLFTSVDKGATFAATGTRPPLKAAAVASPDRATIVIAGSDTSGAALVASFDGGRTWSRVLSSGAVSFVDLGFTTPDQGMIVTTDESGAGNLLMTHDGGRTWTPVTF